MKASDHFEDARHRRRHNHHHPSGRHTRRHKIGHILAGSLELTVFHPFDAFVVTACDHLAPFNQWEAFVGAAQCLEMASLAHFQKDQVVGLP